MDLFGIQQEKYCGKRTAHTKNWSWSWNLKTEEQMKTHYIVPGFTDGVLVTLKRRVV